MENFGVHSLFLGLKRLEKQGRCINHSFPFGFVGVFVMLKKQLQFTGGQFFIRNVLEQCARMIPVGARQRNHNPGRSPRREMPPANSIQEILWQLFDHVQPPTDPANIPTHVASDIMQRLIEPCV